MLERLAALGVRVVRLPRGARADEPHVPVLATDDVATNERVLLFVGETAQDLGILAHRVVGGGGGIEQGSLVGMVRAVRAARGGARPPAVLVANPGELFWWPAARRSLALPAVQGMPRPSAAHLAPRAVPGRTTVPGHETAEAHVARVFEALLARGTGETGEAGAMGATDSSGSGSGSGSGSRSGVPDRAVPRITAIGIAGGADALEMFLDHPDRWRRWGPHMDSLALLGGLCEAHHLQTDAFRAFLRQRGRAYIASMAPVDTPLAGPDGNLHAARATRFGCPVHSAGTSWLTELMFVDAQAAVLAWGEAVARDRDYANPSIEVTYAEALPGEHDPTWAGYEDDQAMADADADVADDDKENRGMSGPLPPPRAADEIQDKLAELSLNNK